MSKPSDAAMRAAHRIHAALSNNGIRDEISLARMIDAEFSPPSDAEREELIKVLLGWADIGDFYHHERAVLSKSAEALSRPAPGWNEACKAIAREMESRACGDRAVAIARGMRKEHGFTCTAETPWKQEHGTPAVHPDAREVGEQRDGWPGGDVVTMHCPHCGITWRMELPQ